MGARVLIVTYWAGRHQEKGRRGSRHKIKVPMVGHMGYGSKGPPHYFTRESSILMRSPTFAYCLRIHLQRWIRRRSTSTSILLWIIVFLSLLWSYLNMKYQGQRHDPPLEKCPHISAISWYIDVCVFVQKRMAIAIMRFNTLLLNGPSKSRRRSGCGQSWKMGQWWHSWSLGSSR